VINTPVRGFSSSSPYTHLTVHSKFANLFFGGNIYWKVKGNGEINLKILIPNIFSQYQSLPQRFDLTSLLISPGPSSPNLWKSSRIIWDIIRNGCGLLIYFGLQNGIDICKSTSFVISMIRLYIESKFIIF